MLEVVVPSSSLEDHFAWIPSPFHVTKIPSNILLSARCLKHVPKKTLDMDFALAWGSVRGNKK